MKQPESISAGAVKTSKTIGLLCGLMFSFYAFSQTNATQPKTFIFSKYQLPAQGDAVTTSFYSTPQSSSPYKIHYKIKTLTFPADTRPERPTSIASAVVNGLIETATKKLFKDNCEETNHMFVPLKPTNTVKY
ncbi:hypothetical protein [Flavisolibacter tropicus]|nr:hypothetical protein [Flavisolibacter tropicus]